MNEFANLLWKVIELFHFIGWAVVGALNIYFETNLDFFTDLEKKTKLGNKYAFQENLDMIQGIDHCLSQTAF